MNHSIRKIHSGGILSLLALVLCSCGDSSTLAAATPTITLPPAPTTGLVSVSGTHILRDGQPWVPHGFYQIAFEVSPTYTDPGHTFWRIAYDNYSAQEYADMLNAGADSVRIQVSQPGMDPMDPNGLYSAAFETKVIYAISAARQAGLTVFVSVQDEKQTGEKTPETLPNKATQRVWNQIAPYFNSDKGVVFELFNEPSPVASSANWAAWATAMNATIQTIRTLHGKNVVVADGLSSAQELTGAPSLVDSLNQVVYAAHPYANSSADATEAVWAQKFGNFAQTAPVIITEWGTGYDKTAANTCDPTTPQTTVKFFNYLSQLGVGLEMGAWDWAAPSFGTARYSFPTGGFTSYYSGTLALACSNSMFGPGATVEVWYKTGTPAASPQ